MMKPHFHRLIKRYARTATPPSGEHKLQAKTLNRLALLMGFQTWEDLREAVSGEGGAQLNYDTEQA